MGDPVQGGPSAATEADAVALDDIRRADRRIREAAEVTPLLPAPAWSERIGRPVYFKCENLQRTGAFKLRGAFNKLRAAAERGELRGVVTASSGNHGQAVAYAARHHGVPCLVVVPETVVAVKEAAIRGLGAEVMRCGTTSTERIERARQVAEERGWLYVPPYDDPDIVAGQGTVGLEIIRQLPEVETVLVPIGGGGLTSGIALAVKSLRPQADVYAVEPEIADDTRRSLAAGHVVDIGETTTIADGLRTSHPGEFTFPIVRRHVSGVLTVSEAEIRVAVRHLAVLAKLVVEPSGAVAAAAAWNHRAPGTGPLVCVLSGGNVDPGLLAELVMVER